MSRRLRGRGRVTHDHRGDGMLEKMKQFFSEVAIELKKVSWPSRRETVNMTSAVIILILMLGVFLAVIDSLLANIVKKIIGS
jgi:preprotein translocase subunit SecE